MTVVKEIEQAQERACEFLSAVSKSSSLGEII